MLKKLLIGAVLLITLLIIGGAAAFYFSMNSAIKAGIEEFGPRFTGTTVAVDKVQISPFSGHGSIKGMVIGNPEGFKTPHAISLGEVTVSIDTGTVFSNEVIIKEIRIVAPEIIYEQGLTGSNISELKKTVAERTGSSDTTEKPKTAAGGKRVIIEHFVLTEGTVRLGTKLSDKTVPIALPAVELKDIGRKDGATMADTVNTVVAAVTGSALNVVAASGELLDVGKNAVKGIGEAGKGAVGGVKKLFNRD